MRLRTRARIAVMSILVLVAAMSWAATAYADIYASGFDWGWDQQVPNTMSSDVFDGANWVAWTNQDVTLSSLTGWYQTWNGVDTDTVSAQQDVDASLSVNSSTMTTFTSPITFSAEGTYSVLAAAVDGSGTVFSRTVTTLYGEDTIFGIDKTAPRVSCNAVPVYDEMADVTVSATDTLSGAHVLMVSVDGEPYWGPSFGYGDDPSIEMTVGPGSHVLRFHAYDTAGNYVAGEPARFTVNAADYVPVLSKVSVRVAGRKVTFRGSVTAATHAALVGLVVDRKVAGRWRASYIQYFVSVPRYGSTYSLTKRFGQAGTYRVRAYEGAGRSASASTFAVK